MRQLFVLALSAFITLQAQDLPNGMDEQQLNVMMEQMQKMQQCMSKIDFGSLSVLEKDSKIVEKEIKVLCEQGRRDAAMSKAIAFSNKVNDMKAMKEMKACTKGTMMESMLEEDTIIKGQHICDEPEIKFTVPSQERISW